MEKFNKEDHLKIALNMLVFLSKNLADYNEINYIEYVYSIFKSLEKETQEKEKTLNLAVLCLELISSNNKEALNSVNINNYIIHSSNYIFAGILRYISENEEYLKKNKIFNGFDENFAGITGKIITNLLFENNSYRQYQMVLEKKEYKKQRR